MSRKLLASVICIFISTGIWSQDGFITGKVVDSLSREPLAFVSIVYNEAGRGVVTNLDGVFRIPKTNKVQFFKLRYIGYSEKIIAYNPIQFKNNQIFLMSPVAQDIGEVIVYPTENPAHRIIRMAAENRDINNPEKSGPFTYVSYDKMVFSAEPDSSFPKTRGDSISMPEFNIPDSLSFGLKGESKIDIERFLTKQYLFLMESVNSRKYLAPGKDKEEVIATRVSGISQPSFMGMLRQFQSFSFYGDFVNIANRQFLNPISPGSTDKYFFLIQDTLFTDRDDTVFIISFRPRKGKNFEGMKGVLYINTNGYAIQNVLAEASEQKNELVKVSIQQQYELIDNQRWFPVLLSTTIAFNPADVMSDIPPGAIIGTGKSYIVNINVNPVIHENEFSDVQYEIRPDAHKQPEEVWNMYRTDSLNSRELETYRVIDSIGKAEHIDRTINSFETLLTGYIPGKYWLFDLGRFLNYNHYEGFRFGAGGRTTERISKWLVFEGYLAYGLKDKDFKYKAGLTFNLWKVQEMGLTVLYRNDVQESGGITFTEPWSIESSSFYRQYMIRVMDITRQSEIYLSFRALKYLTAQVYLNKNQIIPTNDYGYSLSDQNPQVLLTLFYITETGIRLRYAFAETFMKTPRGYKFSTGTKYPVLCLNLAKGTGWLNGEFDYLRTEIKITKVIHTRSFGNTRMALFAGMVSGDVPYSKLYVGRGSYGTITFESEQSFGTMRFNEFLSDRFVTLFIKQDFGSLLFKPRGRFRPEIALVHNMGIGELRHSSHHENITYRTMEKGYFESGLLLNNILHIDLIRYGMGFIYRYGPYAYPKTIDNFAFKLTLQLKI